MIRKTLIFFYIFYFSPISLWGQDLPQNIINQLEIYFEENENIDPTILIDYLDVLYESPLDLNKVSYDELIELQLLSSQQIEDILRHRSDFGDFLSFEELQVVPSLGLEDLYRMRPFLKVKRPNQVPVSLPEMFNQSKRKLITKWSRILEQKRGFEKDASGESTYLGDANDLQVRFRSSYENVLRYGFILEKDEGEKYWLSENGTGPDYLTAHLYLRDYNDFLKDLVIGDYSISLGQGLIAHNGFGASKSAWVTDIKRGGRTLRPYNSINENGLMRGMGISLQAYKNLEFTAFISATARDVNLSIDTLDGIEPNTFFTSLLSSGNHRTANEIEDKDAIDAFSIGGVVKYKFSKGHFGINHLSENFSKPLDRSDKLYNLFRFEGNNLANTSIDYSFRHRNLHLFGETAYSSNNAWGQLHGLLVGLDRYLSLALLFRDYGVAYNSINPNAFGEGSTASNERGLYFGLEWQLNAKWKLRSYYDVWQHPWLRFRVDNPSSGQEFLLRLDYYLKRKMLVYTQFRMETKLRNISSSSEFRSQFLNTALPITRYNLRLHCNYKVSPIFETRSRVEFSRFEDVDGIRKGVLLFQDFIYKPIHLPFSFTSRIAYFDTDDYDSRIYTYENSLLFDFSIPAFDGRGIRYYFNWRHKLNKALSYELRIARTFKTIGDQGSGNEAIDGPSKTNVQVQLSFSF